MSELRVYEEQHADDPQVYIHHSEIQQQMSLIGVRFEQWQAEAPIAENAEQNDILQSYKSSVDKLMTSEGYVTADVIKMTPDHPDKQALRQKFLSEHTHSDDEVRFFVQGKGLFYIHAQQKVYAMLCESGDLISVPANTTHWFDMGDKPNFTCIRLFNDPAGWVANYTGSDIADRFPKFGE